MPAIAGGIVLGSTVASNVVLVVHRLAVLLSVLLSTDLVHLVHALGLGQLVDLSADEASDGLLGELVADGLAYHQLLGSHTE